MSKRDTIRALNRVLIRGGKMDQRLYESEMEMYLDDWYENLIADQEEYLVAIQEERGQVAMTLITKDKMIFVNEKARQKLIEKWKGNYEENFRQLMPLIAEILADGEIFISGVSFIKDKQRRSGPNPA